MIKLLCWKCADCGREYEEYYSSAEFKATLEKPLVCWCGGELVPFNLKNNKQRWRFAD